MNFRLYNQDMDIKEIASVLGRLGGLKTSKVYGKKHYARMGKRSVEVRRLKKTATASKLV